MAHIKALKNRIVYSLIEESRTVACYESLPVYIVVTPKLALCWRKKNKGANFADLEKKLQKMMGVKSFSRVEVYITDNMAKMNHLYYIGLMRFKRCDNGKHQLKYIPFDNPTLEEFSKANKAMDALFEASMISQVESKDVQAPSLLLGKRQLVDAKLP